jgi:hypothetical protein
MQGILHLINMKLFDSDMFPLERIGPHRVVHSATGKKNSRRSAWDA